MAERKTAVIVGATGNLGKATCDALEAVGYEIDPIWRSAERPDAALASSYQRLPKKSTLPPIWRASTSSKTRKI